jgi:hypothetical protein
LIAAKYQAEENARMSTQRRRLAALEKRFGHEKLAPAINAAVFNAGALVKVLIAGRWQDAADMDSAGLPRTCKVYLDVDLDRV